MIAQWMAYGIATAGLLALAAWLAESVLRVHGRASRWVWAGALLGSLALPIVVRLSGGPLVDVGGSLFGVEEVSRTVVSGASWEPVRRPVWTELARLDRVLGVVWAVLVAVGLVVYVGTWRRLGSEVRRCRRQQLDGEEVLVSKGWGPAAIGLWSPAVVIPDWLFREANDVRALVLLHEREHVRARDHWLLALSPLVLVAMPWNVAVWWQLRRLRLSVEIDCDRRVLARGIAAERYGHLLIDVAGRATGGLFAPALAPVRSALESRILALTGGRRGMGRWRSALIVAGSGLCVMLACDTPAPAEPVADAAGRSELAVRMQAAISAAEREGAVFELDGRVVSAEAIARLDARQIHQVEILARAVGGGPAPESRVVRVSTRGGGEGPVRSGSEVASDARISQASLPEGATYLIDGRAATREQVLRLPSASIESVEVIRHKVRGPDDREFTREMVRVATRGSSPRF